MNDRRSLGWHALGLTLGALLLEAILLGPDRLARAPDPVAAALRLTLANATPYLVAALSVAALALTVTREPGPNAVWRASAGRAAVALGALALALGTMAAWTDRPLAEHLLHGGARLRGARALAPGPGAPLTASVPLRAIALEDAGALAAVDLDRSAAPFTATVRWCAMRLADPPGWRPRIELVGGGSAEDVTALYEAIPVGGAAILTRHLRVGPAATRVRLRVVGAPPPPVTFHDAVLAPAAEGIAIETGGGDRAYRVAAPAGAPIEARGALTIEGDHVATGFTVAVVSGPVWRSVDLRPLLDQGGVLEIEAEPAPAFPWAVRLVGEGAETGLTPLSMLLVDAPGSAHAAAPDLEAPSASSDDAAKPSVEHPARAADTVRFVLPLDAIDWRNVPPGHVVGVAFLREGTPGFSRLALRRVRAHASRLPSGAAIGAVDALAPETGALVGLFAAKPTDASPARPAPLAPSALRLYAAALALLAAAGPARLARLLRARPAASAAALAVGPLAALALDAGLPHFVAPRLEQAPVALCMLVLGATLVARREVAPPAATGLDKPTEAAADSARAQPAAWIEALRTVAAIGVIAIHVSADPFGEPFPAFEPNERVAPVLLRSLATAFNYPVFLLVSLFLLARTLDRRGPSYGALLRARMRRLAPPFVFWSLFFLGWRHVKAAAFGYQDGYRQELASAASWLGYAVLGSAQYHLHYLPLLFGLVALAPLYRPALARPRLALLAGLTLGAWPLLDASVYEQIASPTARAYALHATKSLAYTGYGLLAFALYRLHERGLSARARRVLAAVALVTLVPALAALCAQGLDVARAGRWLSPDLVTHAARYALPASVLALFLAGENLAWPRPLVRLARLTFGVYLLHPALLDVLEVLERGSGLAPWERTAVNLVVVTVLAFAIAAWIARSPRLRWTIGLEQEARR